MMRSRRVRAQFGAQFAGWRRLLLGLLLAWAPMGRAVQDADATAASTAAAADLARQITAVTGPGSISLTIRNNSSAESSIDGEEIAAIRRALVSGLAAGGVAVRERAGVDADAANVVRVTLSQSARQGVWVAEVQQGPEVRVVMVNVPQGPAAGKPQETPIALRKTFLISQAEPILDAELVPLPADSPGPRHTASMLAVLSPEQIAIYRRDEEGKDSAHGNSAIADSPIAGAWIKLRSFAVSHSRPYPRDIRGELTIEPGAIFKAYLPGVVCTASWPANSTAAAIAISCTDSDDPWPIGSGKAFYNASRNYFTGVAVPGALSDAQPFYSTAELTRNTRGSLSVYAEVSSQFRVSDGTFKVLSGARDWGSDVAGVASGCGSGAQLLATASGDGAEDSLITYEVEGRNAVAASAPLPLEGQVTALWTKPGTTPAEVIMVLEKPQTSESQYEAYSVSVVCNQ